MSFEPPNPEDVHKVERSKSPTNYSNNPEPDIIVLE
jgi:hypothetical protein